MFTSDRLKWRRQAADSCPSLTTLRPSLETDTTLRLLDIYDQHLTEAQGGIPTKGRFQSWQLGGALANSILYDFVERDDLIYRIVGEEIKARFGFNPDGRSYLEFVPPERKASALEAFRLCADTPCAMYVQIEQQFEGGLSVLCEVLGVPLAEQESDSDARYLLFVNDLVGGKSIRNMKRGVMHTAQIVSRCFVDVGFGVPGDFHDLVPR